MVQNGTVTILNATTVQVLKVRNFSCNIGAAPVLTYMTNMHYSAFDCRYVYIRVTFKTELHLHKFFTLIQEEASRFDFKILGDESGLTYKFCYADTI